MLDEHALVLFKAVVKVRAQPHIHAGLPVVHALGLDDPQRQRVHIDAQIAYQIGHDGKAEDVVEPLAVAAADDVSGKGGVNVPVGEDHEARAERRDDLVLQPVGEIGGVEQGEGPRVQDVSLFGVLDGLAYQGRPGPAGREDPVALDFQPLLERCDMGRAPDAVRALNGDQLPFEPLQTQVG